MGQQTSQMEIYPITIPFGLDVRPRPLPSTNSMYGYMGFENNDHQYQLGKKYSIPPDKTEDQGFTFYQLSTDVFESHPMNTSWYARIKVEGEIILTDDH